MGFLNRLFGRRDSGEAPADGGEYVYLRCNGLRSRPCGEAIRVRINPRTDLEEEFAEDGADFPTGYALHKDVLGNRCQNMMRLTIHYDPRKRELNRQVEGATLIDREEYERERGTAPPGPSPREEER